MLHETDSENNIAYNSRIEVRHENWLKQENKRYRHDFGRLESTPSGHEDLKTVSLEHALEQPPVHSAGPCKTLPNQTL